MNGRSPRFVFAAVSASTLSLALVVASLGLARTAHNQVEARDLGFGYPLHFAFSDFTTKFTPPTYPQRYTLNPWEIPLRANFAAFFASWALTLAALVLFVLLGRLAFSRVCRPAKPVANQQHLKDGGKTAEPS